MRMTKAMLEQQARQLQDRDVAIRHSYDTTCCDNARLEMQNHVLSERIKWQEKLISELSGTNRILAEAARIRS